LWSVEPERSGVDSPGSGTVHNWRLNFRTIWLRAKDISETKHQTVESSKYEEATLENMDAEPWRNAEKSAANRVSYNLLLLWPVDNGSNQADKVAYRREAEDKRRNSRTRTKDCANP